MNGYQIAKDLLLLLKMKEIEPLNVGALDVDVINAKEMNTHPKPIDPKKAHWWNQRNLFKKTGGADATYDFVWVFDKIGRTKRKIVRGREGDPQFLTVIKDTAKDAD